MNLHFLQICMYQFVCNTNSCVPIYMKPPQGTCLTLSAPPLLLCCLPPNQLALRPPPHSFCMLSCPFAVPPGSCQSCCLCCWSLCHCWAYLNTLIALALLPSMSWHLCLLSNHLMLHPLFHSSCLPSCPFFALAGCCLLCCFCCWHLCCPCARANAIVALALLLLLRVL